MPFGHEPLYGGDIYTLSGAGAHHPACRWIGDRGFLPNATKRYIPEVAR
jgi:hypothetical protein